MRILVADQNALLLAAISATFGPHCEVVTATRRDACLEHFEQQEKIDVVVACEKLADYTGLELLSEIEAASPDTLRLFAARPATLKRLGKQLDMFGLLGTLSYPIDARKLVVALRVARTKLPASPKPLEAAPAPTPVVKHIVLEAEWDTGERLALLEQELEEAPAPSITPATPAPSAAAAPSSTQPPRKQAATKGPRVRTPTMPTAAQREAFQRALARRKAGLAGGTSGVEVFAQPQTLAKTKITPASIPTQSLAALARMATSKRPLPGGASGSRSRTQQATQPKRRVIVFGSGIAAVLLVAIVSFELRSTPAEQTQHAHTTAPQLFGPNTLTADNSASPPAQVFSPLPPEQAPAPAASPGPPQPQTFDPDTAPPDPPPPPVLERPGPMEPPSMAHNEGPPLNMHEGWNTE
jgi:CheY-like chemotaxis protein